jgi:signal transduction histidine kinase
VSSSERPSPILSSLAHELKTPLTVIKGFAELLVARDDERTRKEAAARIMQASQQLSIVIDDLLAGVAADKGDLGRRLLDAVEARRQERDDRAET